MNKPLILANDKYTALLTQAYEPGDTILWVDNTPKNVPTWVTLARGTSNETVIYVENKTLNALTGCYRVSGANIKLLELTPVTCLNQDEFINQYRSYLGVAWKGDYDDEITYTVQDGVNYQGSSYIALKESVGILPTDTEYWQILAQQGVQGVQGVQGEPGISVIDAESLINTTFLEDSENTNDYVGSFAVAPSLDIGLKVNLKVSNDNTSASTLNVNGLGAISIKKNVIDDLEAGDIKSGQIVPLIFDGTNFQIVGGGGGGAGGADVLQVQVFS